MRVAARRNKSGSHNYQEARIGPIVLTQSFADSPEAIVQQASFRDTLARAEKYRGLKQTMKPLSAICCTES